MLTNLRIVNFKCLQDTGELTIRPLTFLVGPNSSGKSSLLQMLLMLRQTVDSMDIESPLRPNDGWVKLGAYPDFIFGQNPGRKLEVNLSFQKPFGLFDLFLGEVQSLKAMLRFRYNRKRAQIQLEESELESDEGVERFKIFRSPNARRYRAEVFNKKSGKLEKFGPMYVKQEKFYGWVRHPTISSFSGIRHSLVFDSELKEMFYVGPLRELPQRSYILSGDIPVNVGTRGERTAEVLWCATRTSQVQREILQQVNHWVQEFGIALEVRVERLGRSSQYQVLFVDPKSNLAVNLADVGFGASQVLPIIVQGFYVSPGSLLLIEQPEIHLHPRAQATLGSLLVKIAKQGDRRLIVETHSDHVLGRVQRCIAEEKISRDEVAIYYFNPSPEGTQIQEITLDKLGQFEQYPEGFFEEGFQEAVAHANAIRERIAQGTQVSGE